MGMISLKYFRMPVLTRCGGEVLGCIDLYAGRIPPTPLSKGGFLVWVRVKEEGPP